MIYDYGKKDPEKGSAGMNASSASWRLPFFSVHATSDSASLTSRVMGCVIFSFEQDHRDFSYEQVLLVDRN